MNDIPSRLNGEFVRDGRTFRRWEEECGVSASLLQRYVNGAGSPSVANLVKIADADKVNLHWVLTGKGPKTAPNK